MMLVNEFFDDAGYIVAREWYTDFDRGHIDWLSNYSLYSRTACKDAIDVRLKVKAVVLNALPVVDRYYTFVATSRNETDRVYENLVYDGLHLNCPWTSCVTTGPEWRNLPAFILTDTRDAALFRLFNDGAG